MFTYNILVITACVCTFSNWMMLVAFIGTLATLFPLMLKKKETPTNYIHLAAFTLMEAYTIGVFVTFYEKMVVLEAVLLTLGVTAGLSMYTLQSKRDFSSWGAGLCACLWVILFALMLQVIFPMPMLDKAISIAGAIVFSLFIIFDTHMMMHKLSAEEYMLVAINLFLDVLNLFIYILHLLGDRKN